MDVGDPATPTVTDSTPASPSHQMPRKLPDDLPTSLDDRRPFPSYGEETEMYDGWQGKDIPTCNWSRALPVHLLTCCRYW